jgi:hypothetical protein
VSAELLNDDQQMRRIEMAKGINRIPGHMHEAIHRWVMFGYQPGDFLTALLSNDLFKAASHADDQNAAALIAWVRFLYNYCPMGCYRSPAKVAAWAAHRGLAGIAEKSAVSGTTVPA